MADIKTLGDYVEYALKDPRLKRTTHTYISDMFRYYSFEQIFPNVQGLREPLEEISQFYISSANDGAQSERLLLLRGPAGSGKTLICNEIKNALKQYCKTDAGVTYQVDNCPFHQHPFDLVPNQIREERNIVWHSEAAPCPVCIPVLEKQKWETIPVKRFMYGPKSGLAEHVGNDQRREDITHFLGNVDYTQVLKLKSAKANPEAYDWEGKLIWANRGVLDWVEILKSRRQLLVMLLELIQSKVIVMPSFPTFHLDIAFIGATNEGEYKLAQREKVLEPLFSRFYIVEVPLPLSPIDEANIVKHRAYTRMMPASKFRGQAVVQCINEPVLREYIAPLIIQTREGTKGKEGCNGLSPRTTLEIFSHAYNKAELDKEPCISFETYCQSYARVLKSAAQKEDETLVALLQPDGEHDQKVKERFKWYLWKTVSTVVCESSECRRGGQNKYLEYLTLLEKKVQGRSLTDQELSLAKDITDLISTESGKGVVNKEAFHLMMAERLDELKKKHYTHNAQLKEVINQLVSEDVKSLLRNIDNEEHMDENDRLFLTEVVDAFSRKENCCKYCSKDLLIFLGENL